MEGTCRAVRDGKKDLRETCGSQGREPSRFLAGDNWLPIYRQLGKRKIVWFGCTGFEVSAVCSAVDVQ